jgi:hypothetical protein
VILAQVWRECLLAREDSHFPAALATVRWAEIRRACAPIGIVELTTVNPTPLWVSGT